MLLASKLVLCTLLREELISPRVQGSNFPRRDRLGFHFQIVSPSNASIKCMPHPSATSGSLVVGLTFWMVPRDESTDKTRGLSVYYSVLVSRKIQAKDLELIFHSKVSILK